MGAGDVTSGTAMLVCADEIVEDRDGSVGGRGGMAVVGAEGVGGISTMRGRGGMAGRAGKTRLCSGELL